MNNSQTPGKGRIPSELKARKTNKIENLDQPLQKPAVSHNCADVSAPVGGPVVHLTLAMVELTVVRFLVAVVTCWLHDEQEAVVAYPVEENRTMRAQLRVRRLLLTDDQRCRLAVRGRRLGRARLRESRHYRRGPDTGFCTLQAKFLG